MSFEKYFVCSRTLDRLRAKPLACILDGFCKYLEEEGFRRSSVRRHLSNAGHLNTWLAGQGATRLNRLSTSHLNGFVESSPSWWSRRGSKENRVRRVRGSMTRFRQYLESIDQFDAEKDENLFDPLLDQYLIWMRDHQHTSPGTLTMREYSVRHFLKWLGEEATEDGLAGLTAQRVEDFFLSFVEERCHRSPRGSMQPALRTFLRFALYKGFINEALDDAVPVLRTYKLASVPRGLSDRQALAVLDAIARETKTERRDFAILEMLYAYGIRGGQVRALCLEDIYWEKDQILFRALKNGKDSLLPLTQRVGEALVDYLQNARPKTAKYREVFLTCHAPYHPLINATVLTDIAKRRISEAGIESPSKGSHAFRHAFASRKLGEGHSLKEIADVLGHRHLSTTFQYSKVDATALEGIGLEWPGSSCTDEKEAAA